MSELSNEKILEILKTKGKIEAIRYVKDSLRIGLKEAKELVDDLVAKNPDVKPAKSNPLASVIAGCAIVAVIWVGCDKCSREDAPKELSRKERIENLFSAWDGSQPEVVKWIKQHIKDPDSYKHIETKFIDKTDRVGVNTTFTATNSFGGRVTTICVAQIDTLGNLISAELVE
ncbi:MAG: hypothetical protein ACTHMV_14335 [Chitinophagaceae bacterium]